MGSVFEVYSYVYSGYKLPTRPDHGGIDLHPHTASGTFVGDAKILTVCDGKVITAGWTTSGYGNLVVVQNGNMTYYYAHLKSISVKVGQTVKDGDVLGICGTTGNSTGVHLHFEVRINNTRVDPSKYAYVENINKTRYAPIKEQNTAVYKMRLYEDKGETMTVEEFYKSKAKAPVEIMAIGLNANGKLQIARVISAKETPHAFGSDLKNNQYLY